MAVEVRTGRSTMALVWWPAGVVVGGGVFSD